MVAVVSGMRPSSMPRRAQGMAIAEVQAHAAETDG
jgi:hypothetical protein